MLAKQEIYDELWKNEVEDRVDAYEKGKIITIAVKEVFAKYEA